MGITTISSLTTSIRTGARSNLFRVTPTFGTDLTSDSPATVADISFLCKAAQLPGSTLGLIEIPFMAGRRFKVAGDRTYAEWTMTILNDKDQYIRQRIEDIQKLYSVIDYDLTYTKSVNDASISTEYSTLLIEQLNQAGDVTNKYTLYHCWPSDISTIDLSYDTTDTIEEFTVTWSYDYHIGDDAVSTTK